MPLYTPIRNILLPTTPRLNHNAGFTDAVVTHNYMQNIPTSTPGSSPNNGTHARLSDFIVVQDNTPAQSPSIPNHKDGGHGSWYN
jgi:hypothetical protein